MGAIIGSYGEPTERIESTERSPAYKKAMEAVARSEAALCDCNRPDKSDDPHRHDRTWACIYWLAGSPSQEAVAKTIAEMPDGALTRVE